MATPFGHGLAGAIVCYAFRRAGWQTPSVAAAVVAANLPDFDFIPGLMMGDPSLFHHGVSHSIGAVAVAALFLAAAVSLTPIEASFSDLVTFFGACVLSHVVVDYFTVDTGKVVGIPALWPFSRQEFIAPYPIFADVWRSPPYSMKVLLHDLRGTVVEALVLGPILALLLYVPGKDEK